MSSIMRFGLVLFGSVRIPKLRYSLYSVFTCFGRILIFSLDEILFKSGGLCGFLALIRTTQYLCKPTSCATKILHPINLGVIKNSPGAIPGAYVDASGNSINVIFWKKS